MKKLAITAAALAVGCATPALAQDVGPYLGMEFGVMIPEDTKVGDAPDGDYDFWLPMHTGWDGGIYAGYDFGMFRLEAEFAAKHANNDVEDIAEVNGLASYELIGGDQRVLSAMANAYVDFGDPAGVNFFVGGGVGVAWHRAELVDADNFVGTVGGNQIFVDAPIRDTDSAFAWQLMAGVRYPVASWVDLGLKYRYFNAGRFNFDNDLSGASARFVSHSVLATLEFKFCREEELPPPPPPPPPPGERG
jgi:OmpA-OmpF porin, OOP family